MAKLDLRKNLEMPTCGRWAEGRETRKGEKENRKRGQGSYAEAKTIDKVSRVAHCESIGKDTGLKKKKIPCLTPTSFLVI